MWHGFSNATFICIFKTINAYKAVLGIFILPVYRLNRFNDYVLTAQLFYLRQGLPAGPFANSEHSHHSAYAKYYAQHSQQRAQLVQHQVFNTKMYTAIN